VVWAGGMMFNFSFFRMNFYQRLLLIVVGVVVFVTPETLTATTGATMSSNKSDWLTLLGLCCTACGFFGIGRTIREDVPPTNAENTNNDYQPEKR